MFSRIADHPLTVRVMGRMAALALWPFARHGYVRWMPPPFNNWTRVRDFPVEDALMQKLVDSVDPTGQLAPGPDLVSRFLKINGDLRRDNNKQLAGLRFTQHWGPLAKASPAMRQQQLDADCGKHGQLRGPEWLGGGRRGIGAAGGAGGFLRHAVQRTR